MPKRASVPRLRASEQGGATKPKREEQRRASKRISMRQATNMMEAVAFAKLIGLPLVAHLTIHWAYTDVGDDPDGKLFAKFREGLDKWARRNGFPLAGSGHVSECHAGRQRWCIAICCFTCRSNTEQAKGCVKSKRRSIVS